MFKICAFFTTLLAILFTVLPILAPSPLHAQSPSPSQLPSQGHSPSHSVQSPPPSHSPSSRPVSPSSRARMDQVMDSCIKKGFNGVVLIADKGKVTYKKYTGLASRRFDIPFSPASRFHIFSVTKTFTAALIMQLVEQNKISLDSTISVYYPEYKGEAGKKATIRNLLTYSSGRDLKEMRDLLEAYSNDSYPVDTFITKYCSEKLIDTPGTKFNYNNGDYVLLGRIIEKIYGRPYGEVLREKILIPLKMHHTDLLHHDDIIKGMAESYAYRDTLPAQNSVSVNTPEPVKNSSLAQHSGQSQVSIARISPQPSHNSNPANTPEPVKNSSRAHHAGQSQFPTPGLAKNSAPVQHRGQSQISAPTGDPLAPHFYNPTNYYIDNLYSAGGMYSTPEDLLLFDQAIFNHTLLKKATVDTMLTAYKDLGEVAFGFWVYPKKFGALNTLLAERQGGGYGNHSNWIHLIERDLTFIFLANTDAVDLNTMRFRVISAYLGQ